MEAARFALHAFRGERGGADHRRALNRFYAAITAAYPPHFWEDVDRLKAGEAAAAETAIRFMEDDPWFFRAGYAKQKLARYLKRVPLTAAQQKRLQSVALAIVNKRATHEFREYCRLARALATPGLRDELRQLTQSADAAVSRRATWMLEQVELGLKWPLRAEAK